MTTIPIRRALLSVSDKTGIVDLGRALAAKGVELVSTGGTARALRGAGIEVRDVSDLTGFPEMMDGRVKTLHPKVHGGLLAVRDNAEHRAAMEAHGIGAIDLVAVNLYPFEKTVASGASYDEIIENIDIGGPAMVRSAAKNHAYVTVVVDPADYGEIVAALEAGGVPYALRRKLAAKAYARTAAYDAAISNWFAREIDYPDVPWRSFSGTLRDCMSRGAFHGKCPMVVTTRTNACRPAASARFTQSSARSNDRRSFLTRPSHDASSKSGSSAVSTMRWKPVIVQRRRFESPPSQSTLYESTMQVS